MSAANFEARARELLGSIDGIDPPPSDCVIFLQEGAKPLAVKWEGLPEDLRTSGFEISDETIAIVNGLRADSCMPALVLIDGHIGAFGRKILKLSGPGGDA